MAETQIAEFLGRYGLVGAVVLVLLLYRKPLLDMLGRATRDPLVESLGAQNNHFAENNRLLRTMGPTLLSVESLLRQSLKEAERHTQLLEEIAGAQRILLDRGKR